MFVEATHATTLVSRGGGPARINRVEVGTEATRPLTLPLLFEIVIVDGTGSLLAVGFPLRRLALGAGWAHRPSP